MITQDWEGEIVKININMSTIFKKDCLAIVEYVSERGDFSLQELSSPFIQSFGFAYQTCITKIGIKLIK